MRFGLVSFRMSTELGDHSKGVTGIMKSGIDVYLSARTANALKLSGHRIKIFDPLKQFQIDGFMILPFPLEHQDIRSGERIPNVGFLISDGEDKLAYICDTFYCRYRFRGLDYLALGVNYSKETMDPDLDPARKKRLFKSHMSLETAIKFFKANDLSKVREIHVLHVSETNGDKNYFREEIQKVTGKPTYCHLEKS